MQNTTNKNHTKMFKDYFKKTTLAALSATAAISLVSCGDDDGNDNGGSTAKEQEMERIAQAYVSNTVLPTYKLLAEATGDLYDKLAAVKNKFASDPGSVRQSEIDGICSAFLEARAYYEESEAFLFGAATDFGIDPHIDTWPLDLHGLAAELTNKIHLQQMSGDEDEAIAFASGKLGQELLGFHGIEFIIFRNGENRKADALRSDEDHEVFRELNASVMGAEELVYAAAVAGDLRDKCWQLEVAWDDNAPQRHKDRIEELGLPATMNGGSSYGRNMLNTGTAGSSYATWQEVMGTILISGCRNISTEVAYKKIGNPYGNGEEADPNYIESPYSQRSFHDFAGNIASIQNTLYGGRPENRSADNIMAYLKNNNPSLAGKIETDMNAAISALEDCQNQLAGGFVSNPKHPLVGVAQDKIYTLDDDLQKAGDWFARQ